MEIECINETDEDKKCLLMNLKRNISIDENPYAEFCPIKRQKTTDDEGVDETDGTQITTSSPQLSIPDEQNQITQDLDLETKKTVKLSYPCHGPGCHEIFWSIKELQTHYNARHWYICGECKRSLKSKHLLDLHLMEKHDSYFAVLSKRQPMYFCLVETCTIKFIDPEQRQSHCINEHPFLKKYLGTQSAASSIKISSKVKMETETTTSVTDKSNTKQHDNGNVVEEKKKKSNFNSKNVTFGHGGTRFIPRQLFTNSKKNTKKSNVENMDLTDLKSSLD